MTERNTRKSSSSPTGPSTTPSSRDATGSASRLETCQDSAGGPAGTAPGFQAGFVALLGLPNTGKSTLLNRFVGSRLSIVTSKAQTTRRRRLGIYSDEGHQAVFVDTPGLLEPRYLLQLAMRREISTALADADVIVYLADAADPVSLDRLLDLRVSRCRPRLLCINKVDTATPLELNRWRERVREDEWGGVFSTVATRGTGVDALRDAILGLLPPSPPLYPIEDLSAHSVRELASDLIRQACFERLSREVPYSIAVKIDEYRNSDGRQPVYIRAIIYVERESQKGIVIGRNGVMVRGIGMAARRSIEQLVEEQVYLELRVRVLANWRRRPNYLRLLGFRGLPKEN